jgi:hypothetical protein
VAGARAVQHDILEKYPSANLRVYTVWFSMLAGDSRSGWKSGAMPDPRVTHLWDEDRVASQWFSQQVWGEPGQMWDTYLLYGPDATWPGADSAPAPLIDTGATVVNEREQLEASLLPLLK